LSDVLERRGTASSAVPADHDEAPVRGDQLAANSIQMLPATRRQHASSVVDPRQVVVEQ
jgi:hypothetical protein